MPSLFTSFWVFNLEFPCRSKCVEIKNGSVIVFMAEPQHRKSLDHPPCLACIMLTAGKSSPAGLLFTVPSDRTEAT